jgi:hypothetical protein
MRGRTDRLTTKLLRALARSNGSESLQSSHRESGCTAPLFLTSALDGSEWTASRPWNLPQGKHFQVPTVRRIKGWVGPSAGLDALQKRQTPTNQFFIP